MINLPFLVSTPIQPFIKALRGLSKRVPRRKNRADQLALRFRRDLIGQVAALTTHPEWGVRLPERVNQPAFVILPRTQARVLHRRPHSRSGNYCFNLSHQRAANEQGYVLLCVDQARKNTYVVIANIDDEEPYLSLTPEQVKHYAVAVL